MGFEPTTTDLRDLGGDARLLPYCEFELGKTDVLYLRTPQGGGYGDPLDRDPQLVLKDVVNEMLSRDAARECYGVVFEEQSPTIDKAATKRLRATQRKDRLEQVG